jgi:hypothetical protein
LIINVCLYIPFIICWNTTTWNDSSTLRAYMDFIETQLNYYMFLLLEPSSGNTCQATFFNYWIALDIMIICYTYITRSYITTSYICITNNCTTNCTGYYVMIICYTYITRSCRTRSYICITNNHNMISSAIQ